MSDSLGASADPRISGRRKAVQRTRRRRILWRAALAALVALAAWGAFLSPLLNVKRIRVTGGRHTTAEQVAHVAGLDSSDNLLLVSTSSIAAQASRLPWVRTAEVERKLPGTITIRLTERKPSMVLPAGGRKWLIDREGRVLDSGSSSDLPVIAGSPVGNVAAGDIVKEEEIAGALSVFRSLPPSMRRRVEAFFVPTVERLTFSLDDDIQVRYGSPEELASKNEVLTVLLRRLESEGPPAGAYIDVRVPTSPAVSPSAATTAPGTSPAAPAPGISPSDPAGPTPSVTSTP